MDMSPCIDLPSGITNKPIIACKGSHRRLVCVVLLALVAYGVLYLSSVQIHIEIKKRYRSRQDYDDVFRKTRNLSNKVLDQLNPVQDGIDGMDTGNETETARQGRPLAEIVITTADDDMIQRRSNRRGKRRSLLFPVPENDMT